MHRLVRADRQPVVNKTAGKLRAEAARHVEGEIDCGAEEMDQSSEEQGVPPIYVIEVDSLPRGASVEWVAYGSTGSRTETIAIPHLAHLLEMFKGCMR